MSLAQFLRILMARRFIILGCFVFGVAVAGIVCAVLPTRFPATARVMMDVIKPDPVSGQVISSGFIRGYTKTQIELIQDYRVASDVVDRLKFAANPVMQKEYAASNDGTEDFTRYWARKIVEHTDAKLLEGSNILEISYWTGNPLIAKRVVTALRDAYIDANLRFRTDAAGRSADWYIDQANKAQQALSVAEGRKSAFERENGIVMAPGGVDSESMKLEGMQSALMAARGSIGMSDVTAERDAGNAAPVVQLKSQLNTLEDTISQAGQRLGTSHPTYIALVQRRAVLQQQLARETAAARSVGGSTSAAAKANLARLEADYNAQKAKVLGLRNQLDQLGQLTREVELRQSQYQKAAARAADLRLESDVSETGLVPLGDASVSGTPSFPNKPLFLAVGAVAGIGLGLIAGLITEMIARRVRGPEDLARASKVPVLAVVADTVHIGLKNRVRRILRLPGASTRPDWQPAQ